MTEGSASAVINRPLSEVFGAIADVTRMGEWSPECVSGGWVDPATGPALGAKFEGANVANLGSLTLKRWTTTSEVTAYEPDAVFEFVSEGYTTWRYEFVDQDGATRVTESFSYPPYTGWQGFLYGKLMRRQASLVKAVQQTLNRVKAVLEAS